MKENIYGRNPVYETLRAGRRQRFQRVRLFGHKHLRWDGSKHRPFRQECQPGLSWRTEEQRGGWADRSGPRGGCAGRRGDPFRPPRPRGCGAADKANVRAGRRGRNGDRAGRTT